MAEVFTLEDALEVLQDPDKACAGLDINGSGMDNASILKIIEALPTSQITSLDIGYADLGDLEAQALAAVLPKTQITWVSLAKNPINDAGAQALAAALPASKLEYLNLSDTQMGDAGAQAIATALPASLLKDLTLSETAVGDSGAQAIATALPVSPLEYLSLSYTKVGVIGVQAIAVALPGSPLVHLNLSHVSVSDAAVQMLAAVLPASQLTALLLGHEAIGGSGEMSDAGAQAFLDALPKTTVIMSVMPDNISIDLDLAIHETVRENKDKTIALSNAIIKNIPLSDEELEEFARLLPAVKASLTNKMDQAAVTEMLLRTIEPLCVHNPTAAKSCALKILPLNEACAWLADHDIVVDLTDFLNEDGRIPLDRYLCKGGFPAVFAQQDWWPDKNTAGKAFRSLPPEQQPFVYNMHQLSAELHKRKATIIHGVS